jgi:hypothetical protein
MNDGAYLLLLSSTSSKMSLEGLGLSVRSISSPRFDSLNKRALQTPKIETPRLVYKPIEREVAPPRSVN